MTAPQTSRVTNVDEIIPAVPFDGAYLKTASVSAAKIAGGVVVGNPPLEASFISAQAEETIRFRVAGAQTTGTDKDFALIGVDGTIVDVRAYLLTAPTTTSFIVDVNKNETSIFTTQGNRPTIAATGHASSTTAPDVTSVAAGDRLSIDVDQIGSGVAGSDLMVSVTLKRALVN